MKCRVPTFRIVIIPSICLTFHSCTLGTPPSVSPLANSKEAPLKVSTPSHRVPTSIMSCNLTTNGAPTIYTFEVNSNRVASTRLPNGSNRLYPKGYEPRYRYSVISQSAKTAKLVIQEKKGSIHTTKTITLRFGNTPSEGVAKIITMVGGQPTRSEAATFFLNSKEFYR